MGSILLGMLLGIGLYIGQWFLERAADLLGDGPPKRPDTPDADWRSRPDTESDYRYPADSWDEHKKAMKLS